MNTKYNLMDIKGVENEDMASEIESILTEDEKDELVEYQNALNVVKGLYDRECDKEYAEYHLGNAIKYIENMIEGITVYNPNYVFR